MNLHTFDDVINYEDHDHGDRNITTYFHRCFYPWSRYAIKPNGLCKDLETGRIFEPLPGGERQKYPNLSLVVDGHRKTTTVMLHRVLASTFLHNTTGLPFSRCQVDHKDSNKKNYDLDNLEIVTERRNKALTYIKNERTDNFNMCVEDIETGERFYFYSQAEAARFIGESNQWMSYRFKSQDVVRCWPYEVWKITREEYNRAVQSVMTVRNTL